MVDKHTLQGFFRNGNEAIIAYLTHFTPMFYFYTSWTFSGSIEMDALPKPTFTSYTVILILNGQQKLQVKKYSFIERVV